MLNVRNPGLWRHRGTSPSAHGFLEAVMSELRLDRREGLDGGGTSKVWETACVKVWELHGTKGILRKFSLAGARVGKGRHRMSVYGELDG